MKRNVVIWGAHDDPKHLDALKAIDQPATVFNITDDPLPVEWDGFDEHHFPRMADTEWGLKEYTRRFEDFILSVVPDPLLIPSVAVESRVELMPRLISNLPYDASYLDKAVYYDRLASLGVRVPQTYLVLADGEKPQEGSIPSFPCVLKPALGTGSEGVQLVHAVDTVREFFATDPPYFNYVTYGGSYLVQEYVEGHNMATAVNVMPDGRIDVEAVFDVFQASSRDFFGETGYLWPCGIDGIESMVRDLFQSLLDADFAFVGPWMMDFKLDADTGQIVVIELTPRPSADALNLLYYGLDSNYYLEKCLSLYTNPTGSGYPDRPDREQRIICYRTIQKPPGVVRSVRHSFPHPVIDANVRLRPGQRIGVARNTLNQKSQGFIVTTGGSRMAAMMAADDCHDCIEVEYENPNS